MIATMTRSEDELHLALAHLSDETQDEWLVLERYHAGEFGAYRVSNGQSVCALKLSRENRIRRAETTTRKLRLLGTPAPLYIASGPAGDHWYALMEELPG